MKILGLQDLKNMGTTTIRCSCGASGQALGASLSLGVLPSIPTNLEELDGIISLILLLPAMNAHRVYALEQEVLVNIIHILGTYGR